ncbi:MAG: N-formylglutamate amidohydrolase [Pacificimonas sp.]|jgi:predicted N-formylglutamate amidohydrolase|nr:N-formylglutamate amidohydrolase [Pacificimonas sp.]
MAAPHLIDGPNTDLLIVVDHASRAVPPDIALGLPAGTMDTHIAVDLGAAETAERLAARTGAPLLLAGASRLVVDLNRPLDQAVTEMSDGVAITGNHSLTEAARAGRTALHRAYHDQVAALLDERPVRLLLSLHSFTPALDSGEVREWQCGVLYNEDRETARAAIRWLEGQGLRVGDNEPYSGVSHGYTVQRHAEPRGLPYLFFEIRNDLIADAEGQSRWAALLRDLSAHLLGNVT